MEPRINFRGFLIYKEQAVAVFQNNIEELKQIH